MVSDDTFTRIKSILSKITESSSIISVDALLDAISVLVQDCSSSAVRKHINFKSFVNRYEEIKEFIRQRRLNISDFEEIKVIGRGAYGKVSLVRNKESRQIYAMKQMSKRDMIDKGECASVFEERQVMATAASEWVVRLQYSFHDFHSLYMIMEYVPGGNLLKIMEDYELTEKWAKFYIAEVVIALSVIHGIGYAHRDIKPENILIDRTGHVKLADFGTCVKLDSDGFVTSSTAVGTPDYISPEVLQSESHPTKYGIECDYWSVGVLIYEILYGDPPFYADSLVGTYSKIMDYKRSLMFPNDVQISPEAMLIITDFLTDHRTRLGRNGLKDIKSHKFFSGTSWTFDNIRDATPPVVPEIKGDLDTQYFDEVVEDLPLNKMSVAKTFEGNNIPFIGFTYNADFGVKAKCYRKSEGISDTDGKKNTENANKLNAKVDQLNDLNNSLEVNLKENDVAKMRKIASLEEELKDSCLQLKETEKKLNLVTIDINEANNKLTSLVEQNSRLKNQVTSFRDSSVQNKDEVYSLTKQVAKYEEKISKLQLELKSLANKQSNDAEVYSSVHSSLIETQQKLIDKDFALSSALASLESIKEDQERLSKEKANLDNNLNKANSSVSNLKSKMIEIESDFTSLKDSKDELMTENEEIKQEIARLRELSKSQGSGPSSVDNEVLEAQIKVLREKLNQVEKNGKQTNVLYSAEKAKRMMNAKETEKLNQKIEELNVECNKFKTEINMNKAKMDDLQHVLTTTQRNLASNEILLESQSISLSTKDNRIREMESEVKVKDMEIMGKNEEVLSMEKIEINLKNKITLLAEELSDVLNQLTSEKKERLRFEELFVAKEKEIEEIKFNEAKLQTELSFSEEVKNTEELEKTKQEYLALTENYKKLEKSFYSEKVKKEQAVNKLAEISQLKMNMTRKGKKGLSSEFEMKLKKKEMDYKRLEQELNQTKAKFESERKMLNKQYDELLVEKNTMQLELFSVKAMSARSDIASVLSSDGESQKEGILYTKSKNIKRHGWIKNRVIFNDNKLLVYDEKNKDPHMVIDIGKVYHVRSVTSGDVCRAKRGDIPKIFQILYCCEGVFRKESGSFRSTNVNLSEKAAGLTYYKGHEMVPISYRTGDVACDMCHKGMVSFFNPQPAMECKNCHVKLHRGHVESNEYDVFCNVTAQKTMDVNDLLLLAPTVEDQKSWLKVLLKAVKERGYVKQTSDAKSLTIMKSAF